MDRADEVGYRAWDEFYNQMERRFRLGRGRKEYWGHRYYKAFRQIAEECLKLGINVTDFVITNFDSVQKNHMYITPRDFADRTAFERYNERMDKVGTQVGVSWITQVSGLIDMEVDLIPDIYPNAVDLLMDIQLPFNAWFRVLYPEPFNNRLFDLYGQTAWAQLQEDVRLRAYLRKQCPVNLKELETRLGIFSDACMEGE